MTDTRLFFGSSRQCPRLFICTREALVWNRLAAGRYLPTERWQHGPQDLHLSRTSPRCRKRRWKLDFCELLTWHIDLSIGDQDSAYD
jgi:hypothetical protein